MAGVEPQMTIERLTLNDPDAQSAYPVAANIAALKALFPAVVADGRVIRQTIDFCCHSSPRRPQ